jgi:hypothetical protein
MPPTEMRNKGRRPTLSRKKVTLRAKTQLYIEIAPLMVSCFLESVIPILSRTYGSVLEGCLRNGLDDVYLVKIITKNSIPTGIGKEAHTNTYSKAMPVPLG